MTKFNVHIYREMRLVFEGIDADSHEAAAAIARDKPTRDADEIDDCEGENLSALVDVVGDEEYEQSCFIDFEEERQRRAAPKLLAALEYALEFLEANDDGDEDVTSRIAASRAAIADANAAGIQPQPSPPRLLHALQAVLPYAWNERASLRECWERDSDPKVKAELKSCDRALDQAEAAIAGAKAAGIAPQPAAETGGAEEA